MAAWENMSAGPDIDEVVAKRLGWDRAQGGWWHMSTSDGVNSLKSCEYPKYSEDWRATGELIEYIERSGLSVTIRSVSVGVYESVITERASRRRHVETGASAQLAVVKSFLKATEKEPRSIDIC